MFITSCVREDLPSEVSLLFWMFAMFHHLRRNNINSSMIIKCVITFRLIIIWEVCVSVVNVEESVPLISKRLGLTLTYITVAVKPCK